MTQTKLIETIEAYREGRTCLNGLLADIESYGLSRNLASVSIKRSPTQLSLLNNAEAGYRCSCCNQFVKIYHRKLNTSMACVLLLIYRSGKRNFFKVEDWLKEIGRSKLRADFHKLRFWKLLEPKMEDREDGSSRNGFYRITSLGILFCEEKLTAKERAVIYNNKLQYLEGEEIKIKTALGSRFDYSELMSA